MDAARKLLVDTLARRADLDLKKLSLTIGRNHAYLQQYLMRGSPRELPEAVRHGLAPLLGVAPEAVASRDALLDPTALDAFAELAPSPDGRRG